MNHWVRQTHRLFTGLPLFVLPYVTRGRRGGATHRAPQHLGE